MMKNMRIFKFMLAFACILFTLPSLSFSRLTGEKLLEFCKPALKVESRMNAQDMMHASFCMGYIGGIIDMHFTMSAIKPHVAPKYEDVIKRYVFCIPNEVTTKQKIRIVVSFLENNPRLLHLAPASVLVARAYTKAFPCKK